MPVAQILAKFQSSVSQCENLITNAHNYVNGMPVLPEADRQQVTVAAFLNMFIAWETFLEECFLEFMMGAQTLNGSTPIRYVSPVDVNAANKLILGVERSYFDYAKHDNVLTLSRMFFQGGYPFALYIAGAYRDLEDARAMRNWCAHKTSSTQAGLDGLALRIFAAPRNGITLYALLMAVDPREPGGMQTVFVTYKRKMLTLAEMIANG